MNYSRPSSLESYIALRVFLICLPLPLFFAWWAWSTSLSFGSAIFAEFIIIFLLFIGGKKFKHRIVNAFDRASLHLEAINNEDYKQFAKPAFNSGKVYDFHQQLNSLSTHLQQQKSRYDQHAFLVYQLIEELNTPIIVFNVKGQLSFANGAFFQLYQQPWQMFRHSSHDLLGLEERPNGWQFKDKSKNKQWQIRQSVFEDSDDLHQLLVFVNIESALRANQLDAWQQIIRVLSHEIRNSLTPVSSLAESLLTRINQRDNQLNNKDNSVASSNTERDKQALNLISDRCLHLQNFVERYSSLSKTSQLNCQWLSLERIISQITGLYQDIIFNNQLEIEKVWADPAFLEQVLINLIKNSVEAQANKISITSVNDHQSSLIIIKDNGQGFGNIENLFVPLYSTKPEGQGIGLSFCRNIIEQHGGNLKLVNNGTENQQGKGVTATITLPVIY